MKTQTLQTARQRLRETPRIPHSKNPLDTSGPRGSADGLSPSSLIEPDSGASEQDKGLAFAALGSKH